MSIANISATTTFVHEPFEGRNTTQQFCDNLMQQPPAGVGGLRLVYPKADVRTTNRPSSDNPSINCHKLQCMIVRSVPKRWCYDPCRLSFLPPGFLCCSSWLTKSFCRNESHDQRAALSNYTAKNLLGLCSVCADAIVICPICFNHTRLYSGTVSKQIRLQNALRCTSKISASHARRRS